MLPIIITILLIVMCLVKKDSKLLFNILFIWMIILFAFNYSNADYEMYQRQYIRYGVSNNIYDTEILFQLMCKIFYNLNFTYNQFIFIYSMIPLMLIRKFILNFSKNRSLTLACYFIFPFLLDVVQIRNFMAISIVLYSFKYLIGDEKKGNIKYIIGCLIASGFHYISLFYILFIFLKKNSIKKIIFIVVPITLCLMIISKSSVFINILSLVIPQTKLDAYFVSGEWQVSKLITILSMIIQLFIIAILMSIYFINKKRKEKYGMYINDKVLLMAIKCNVLLILAFPIYFYTFEFTRIFRGMMALNYLGICNTINNNITINNTILKILALVMIAILFYILIVFVGIYDKTIVSIFENNYLFDFIGKIFS